MKQHTVKGAELLEQISNIQTHATYLYAADIARHHHERWDGTGYPDGLSGKEISVAAQVVSIVDVYDALVSMRVYKAAYTPDEAVNMIINGECGAFNPELIRCFLEAEPVIRQWYLSDERDEVLNALTEDSKITNTVYDEITKENENTSDSVMDIMLLMTAVQNAYDAISAVNLSKNTFHLIGVDKVGIHSFARKGDYDEIIRIACEYIPIPYRSEFYNKFNRQSLLTAYEKGRKIVKMEYQQYADNGEIRWLSTKVLLMQDSRTGDVIQVTLMQIIDEEYERRAQARKILTDAQNIAEHAKNMKSEILREIKQDISNHLVRISDIATAIEDAKHNQDKIKNYTKEIKTCSSHLINMLNDSEITI